MIPESLTEENWPKQPPGAKGAIHSVWEWCCVLSKLCIDQQARLDSLEKEAKSEKTTK